MQITRIRLLPMLLLLLLTAIAPDTAQTLKDKALSSSDVVGSYFIGGGCSGTTITLKANGQYLLEGFEDTDPQPPTISGTYQVENSVLHLKKKAGEIALMVVPWGKRLYFIPDEQMLQFCNAVNAGDEPRWKIHGRFILRVGDENKLVTQLPKVPAKWQDYLLKKPVTGKVISITHTNKRVPGRVRVDAEHEITGEIIEVKVNVGEWQGLKPGMWLRLLARQQKDRQSLDGSEMAEIRKVEPKQAIAEFAWWGEEKLPVSVGATAITHWNN